MKKIPAILILEKLRTKWLLIRIAELFLLALAVGSWMLLVTYLLTKEGSILPFFVGGISFLIMLALFIVYSGVLKISTYTITRYLNRKIENLEASTELLLKEDSQLSVLARLQKDKIAALLPQFANGIKIPNHLNRNVLLLIVSIIPVIFLFNMDSLISENITDASTKKKLLEIQSDKKSLLPVGVASGVVLIQAPAYTGMGNLESKNLNVKAPEQSELIWRFNFDGEINKAVLVFSNKDSLRLEKQVDGSYKATRIIQKSGFYSLYFTDTENNPHNSDFYAIEVLADRKPLIKVSNLDQYTDLQFNPHLSIQLEALITDDYGLTDAFIVATVSKGKGESVKFREEKILFDNGFASGSTSLNLGKSFKLSDLGMVPGDELYFYIEAHDNKQPINQKSKSEVYFIALADTNYQSSSMELGLGINQMPDYFRSQRQLIIDTEKLIAQKTQLTEEEFILKGNDIGVDQKILRLRYGQFLGEEFESTIGGHDHHDGEEENEEAHEHFEGDGHGQEDQEHKKWKEESSSLKVLEKNEKDHANTKKGNGLYSDVPESVMHIHDVQEEMSFLDETLKAELRVILNLMWESELRLRTNRLQESLPYQYKALYLLKDIQQKSRVYVERVGFAPPPLEEKGKRLTADLSKVENGDNKRSYEVEKLYPNLIQLLNYLEKINDNAVSGKNIDTQLFYNAGLDMSQLAIEKPGTLLKSLKIIKQVADGQLSGDGLRKEIPSLIKNIWTALPSEKPQPTQTFGNRTILEKMFLKEIGN